MFSPDVIEQIIRRRLSDMEYRDVQVIDEALRNIETIGRGMINWRKARAAQRISDLKDELKARVREEWADRLEKRRTLAATSSRRASIEPAGATPTGRRGMARSRNATRISVKSP